MTAAEREERNVSASPERERAWMVERHIAARGVRDERVLEAMRQVPRERFVAAGMEHAAYRDAALPIGEAQTISQPYVVAYMAEAAALGPRDRVLEVGTGSGYAAAVFSRIAERVYTVERHPSLAAEATERFEALGYDNVEVAVRDGTLGWPEHAPYDAIIVAAASPDRVPPALLTQLAPGGRLVIPRGETQAGQDLVRIERSADGATFGEQRLCTVRFVPLVGEAGWTADGTLASPAAALPEPRHGAHAGTEPPGNPARAPAADSPPASALPALLAAAAEPFDALESADLAPLLRRLRGARLVLLGEASHGTSEFYRMRARITQELIEREGFDFVAVEADWPDAAEIDAYVRRVHEARPHSKPFQRFPRWMWANAEVLAFVKWLRAFNDERGADPARKVAFHGLDLYSLNASMDAVLRYLDDVDPHAAAAARHRYGCLTPWQDDPVLYGRAVLAGTFEKCESEVVAMLNHLLSRRLEYARNDGTRFVDAVQNARLVVNAERYYRAMNRGSIVSWNLRDQHMFDTLALLLRTHGPDARGVVWAHNSHLGDASATAMGARGEHNVGQLAREAHGGEAYLVGFGTHTGTVAAADDWGEPMQVMKVRPSHPRSYEHVAHASGVPRFLLPLREPAAPALRERLGPEQLERAIGVIYRPDAELQSHYFTASLPRQFDEWIWFDETTAVTPIGDAHHAEIEALPDTFPFGL